MTLKEKIVAAFNKKLDKTSVVPPSSSAATGQAADAKATVEALDEKVDGLPTRYVTTNGKNGFRVEAYKDENGEWKCDTFNLPEGFVGPIYNPPDYPYIAILFAINGYPLGLYFYGEASIDSPLTWGNDAPGGEFFKGGEAATGIIRKKGFIENLTDPSAKAALFTDASMKIERVVRNFNRDAVNESAIMKSFKIPQYLKSRLAGKTLKAIRMQGPTTATGPWDSTDVALILLQNPFTILIPSTSEIEVGKPVEFKMDAGFSIDTDDDYIHISSQLGQSKFGLIPVDSSLGYDIEAANGKRITNYAPFLEFVEKDGTVISTAVNDVMSTLVDAGAVNQLATNATQSQIIAKVNELISKLRKV